MLTTKALYQEIETIEKVIDAEKDAYKKASLKAQVLVLKLLHNLRTNTVQFMKHFKIENVKPKARDDQEEV